MPPTLAEVETLVGQLSDAEQAMLRDRLPLGSRSATTPADADRAVEAFRRELDRVDASPLSVTEQLFLDREGRACSLSTLASGSAAIPEANPPTGPAGTSSTG